MASCMHSVSSTFSTMSIGTTFDLWVCCISDFKAHDKKNEDTIKNMLELAKSYNKAVQEEDQKSSEKFQIDQVS